MPILAQLSLGIYLKLHVHEKTLRPYAVRAHGILGRVWPILGWVQGLFGVIVLRGFCGEAGAGQCAAHYIMVRRCGVVSRRRRVYVTLGKRVHRLWDHYGHLVNGWRKLDTSKRKESGVVGFVGHYALGSFTGL